MDLVDEEGGARAEGRGFFGVDHDLLDFLDAGEDGGELDEAGAGLLGDDLGERGFADAGRAPEDDRGGVVALDQHAERLAGAEEMLLPGELVEGAGPHPLGERSGGRVPRRLEVGRGSEEAHAPFVRARVPVRLLRDYHLVTASSLPEALSGTSTWTVRSSLLTRLSTCWPLTVALAEVCCQS